MVSHRRMVLTEDEQEERCEDYGHPLVDEGVVNRCPCGVVDLDAGRGYPQDDENNG